MSDGATTPTIVCHGSLSSGGPKRTRLPIGLSLGQYSRASRSSMIVTSGESFRVRIGEVASGKQRYSHRAKVTGSDNRVLNHRRLSNRQHRKTFDCKTATPVTCRSTASVPVALAASTPGRLRIRSSNCLKKRRTLIVFLVFRSRQTHTRVKTFFAIEPDIDASQTQETLDHQSRANSNTSDIAISARRADCARDYERRCCRDRLL
jgi:hypothetical protein